MKTRIVISEPCKQSWDDMALLGKGRYCRSCKKIVTDFTKQSREEIIGALEGKTGVCGRVDISHLKEINPVKSKQEIYLAKWAVLLGIGSILGITTPVIASNSKPKIEIGEKSYWKSILPPTKHIDTVTIKGIVLEESGTPLPGVNVIFKGSNIIAQTNFDGEFLLTIPQDILQPENILVFSYIGFEIKEYSFYKANKFLNITLTMDSAILGELVIIQDFSVTERVGSFFSNLFAKKKDEID